MAASIGAARIELSINSAEFEAQMKRARTSVGQFRRSLNNVQKNFQRTGRRLEGMGRSWSRGVTLPALAAGGAAVKAAIDFQSAFAGVRKTVDATESEFAGLKQGIREMSTEIPIAATEIAGIAESAGQLGIQNKNILSFTRVMADLGVATNMASNEAATALARLANITQMPQSEFERLGSVVVELGNNLATTEAEIVEMAQRLAGSGKQAGLAEAEILSFAGALSSVGIRAESGGTSFSKVMDQINLAVQTGSSALEDFAGVAGMSTKRFREAFREDAAEAVITFVEGLGRMEESGGSALQTLEEMGITERRMRDALLRAAGAGDLLRRSIRLGNDAWRDNIALAKEAAQRYETDESQLQLLKNEIYDVALGLSEAFMPAFRDAVSWARRATSWFSSLSDETKSMGLAIAGVAAAVGPTLMILGKLATAIGALMTPIGLVVAGVAALAAAVYTYWDEITQFFSSEGPEFMQPVRDALESVARFAKTMFNRLMGIFEKALNLLGTAWENWGGYIVSTFKTAFTTIGGVLSIGLEGFSTVLDIWSGRWLTDWDGFLADTKESFRNVFGVSGDLRGIFGGFLSWLATRKEVQMIRGAFEQGLITSGFGEWGMWLKGLGDEADKALEDSEQTANSISDVWAGLAEKLSNLEFDLNMPDFFGGGQGFGAAEKVSGKRDDLPEVSLPGISDAAERAKDALSDVDWSQYQVAGDTIEDLRERWANSTDTMGDKWNDFVNKSKAAGFDFVNFLSSGVANAIGSFAESIGVSLAGAGDSFSTGLEQILLMVADFAKQLGNMLIGIGSAMAIIPGLQGSGGLYIAGGAALVALASGVAAGIQKRIENRKARASESQGKIPGMAQGGIIPPGFPDDTYMAGLTSGERVYPDPIPLSRDSMGAGMNKRDMYEAMTRALAGAAIRIKDGDLVLALAQGRGKYG